MARLADRVMDNPAKSGGLFVMALTTAAVVSNALFLQHSRHPEPWFATRPDLVAVAPGTNAVAVPDPRPRGTPPVEPPTPRLQPQTPPSPAASTPAATLVADVQKALSELGLYRGKIDGISGTRTRAAITAYEQSQGLPVTGQPSPVLLDHMVTASIAPAAPPPPSTAQPSPDTSAAADFLPPVPVAPPPEAVAAVEPSDDIDRLLTYPGASAEPATVTKVSTAPEPQAAPAPPPADIAVAAAPEPDAAPAADVGSRRTLSVQKALNQIGYGPVPENGVAGEGTVAAIRRFELDNGLPITGAAGDTVIERLVAIGAMAAA